jgi:xanthine dehydrogenase YagR molybdenum-binding subunit
MSGTIGKPVDRVDGRQKVTGGARYAAEHNLPKTTYGALVMATIPSGTIRAIDARAALKSPGVLAVISHLNAPKLNPPPQREQGGSSTAQHSESKAPPPPQLNLAEPEYLPFADNRVHYVGQRIAVVVADTLEHAMRGAELVKVTYDAAPARTDLHKLRGEAFDRSKSAFAKGDADAALASAPFKVEREYRTPHEHHNPIEGHGCVAAWSQTASGDHLTLYDSSQNIFAVRGTFAHLFGIPKDNVHVLSPFVGGAFGSKGSTWPHVVIAVMAAKVVKRPVKIAVTRKQLFFANGHRPETVQRIALGANADGKLVSIVHEGYSQSNEVCTYVERFVRPTRAIYACPNIRGSNPVVTLHLPSPTYMRAPGENPGMFAIESAMDELAYALKIDPVQLRLINHADADPIDGKPWSSKSLRECYQQAAERFGWSKRNPEPRSMRDGRLLIGWGMATATYPAHRAPASARATVKADGTFTISSGSHEMGMGTATVMAQLAAETLGVPVERVRFAYGDTTLPQAPISAGSLTAASVGSAVYGAAKSLREKVASLEMSDPASLTADSYHAILAKHYLDELDARFDAKPDPEEEKYAAQAFGAHFIEVAVDPDIPIPRVRRVVSAFAGGRILNAKTARSQFWGGIVQGIGMALLEETHLDTRFGSYTNVNFGEYLVPVNADIHAIDVILVPEEDRHVNPIGVKGVGEIGIVGVAPAIANAVFHATGKRVRELPIRVEKLM